MSELSSDTNRINPVPGSLDHRFLQAQQNSVEILRRQYTLDPRHPAPLISGLCDLEGRLRQFGRWEEARNTAAELVDIRRVLYAADPAAFRADLASSFYHLSIYLEQLKLWEDARVAAAETVSLQRLLYATDPDLHRASFADSLQRLGLYLSRVKLHEDARVAIAESIGLQRILYTANPDSKIYCASLASSLYFFSGLLCDLKLWEDARIVVVESVDLRRVLYKANPEAYLLEFASSLSALNSCLHQMGLLEDRRVVVAELISLQRVQYTENPEAHRVNFATSLHKFGIFLGELGLWENARIIAAEAVDLRRALYTADPEAYCADLAFSLCILGICLGHLKLGEDARVAGAESVNLLRPLYTADQEKYRDRFAHYLQRLVASLDMLDLEEDARIAVTELVDLRRLIYTANPDSELHHAHFAHSLHYLGIKLAKLKLWEDARVATSESIHLRRALYAANPMKYRVELIESLYLLGGIHENLGDLAAASSAEMEAASLLDLTDYNIQTRQFVGAGGFGSVYQAESEKPISMPWDRNYDRKLIIKVLQSTEDHTGTPSSLSDIIFQRQTNREINIWHRLLCTQHRNVVGFFGRITLSEQRLGLVSEYFSSGNIMKNLDGTPLADLAVLCHDVARGLRYLHTFQSPVIHGDLKPSNVVVHEDGRAALCDFGLSSIIARVPISRKIMATDSTISQTTFRYTTPENIATLRYLAPEQLSSDAKPTFAADVYAFACTLAEILIGKQPFASMEEESEIMTAISSAKRPYELAEITERFPNFAFLDKCWAADPTARPSMDMVCEWMGVSI